MLKKLVKEYPLLLVIMVSALIIRLMAGYFQSFSNDELSALYRLQFNNFYDLIHWGVKVDGHPALVQLFLYIYQPLVGKSELLIRLPFILASTLSLGYIFFSLKKLSGEFTAYMVVIILAFAGFSIQLGYFARPYALGILFTSMATYYWIKIFIEQEKGKRNMILFILVSILACYTHYFALLEIAMLGAATFLFAPIRLWWRIIVSGGIVLLAYLPNYPILAFQLSVGGIGGWLGKPKNYFLVDLVLTYFDRNPIIIGAFVLFLMLVVILQPAKPVLKRIALYLFLSLVPFVFLYFYSIKINSLLQPSACFFFMPFLLAAFFSMFESGKEAPVKAKWGYITTMVIFWGSVLIFNSAFAPIHFAEFKRIAKYIEENESDSVTTVVAVNNPFYIDWYLKDKKPDLYITDMGDDLKFLRRYIDTCDTKEFIYAFTNQRSNGEIPFMVESYFPIRKKRMFYNNSELYKYSRAGVFNREGNDEPEFLANYSYIQHKGIPNISLYKPDNGSFVKNHDGNGAFILDSLSEFSLALEVKLKDLKVKPSDIVVASAKIFPYYTCDVEFVVSVERNGKAVFWRSRKYFQQYIRPWNYSKDTMMAFTGADNPQYFGISETFNHSEIDFKKDVLKIFVWNPLHCKCLINDLEVSILHGNPFTSGYSQ